MAKVFVSHRGADTVAAERLAIDLRAAGHDVWFDEWEIEIGDSITLAMNSGLTGADFVVLCYSADGVEAPWISREWASALADQLRGRGVRVLPAFLTGRNAPAIFSDIKAADLTRDWDAGVAALLKAMARR